MGTRTPIVCLALGCRSPAECHPEMGGHTATRSPVVPSPTPPHLPDTRETHSFCVTKIFRALFTLW